MQDMFWLCFSAPSRFMQLLADVAGKIPQGPVLVIGPDGKM